MRGVMVEVKFPVTIQRWTLLVYNTLRINLQHYARLRIPKELDYTDDTVRYGNDCRRRVQSSSHVRD
jgi:hypothetical protein